jgi:hypothetical protein
MLDDNQDFWYQAQQQEQQMLEHELRIQQFKLSLDEVMQNEARANQALSSALQEAIRQIDIAITKLGVNS